MSAKRPAFTLDSVVVGKSPRMRDVFDFVKVIADGDSSVLITGESGTGKELVANLIHHSSARRNRPFVAVSCAILAETLIETELFGHERGAFTNAIKDRPGRFELAQGGTLFLDDIDDVPMAMQVKLLRVLQTRTVERVGGVRGIPIDVRVLTGSKRDLRKLVAAGVFREDLYYRLDVIPIHLPPLRDRAEDIPALVAHFIGRIATDVGKTIAGISPEALAVLERYHWPGNIRELENVVERAIVLGSGEHITAESLPPHLARPAERGEFPVEIPAGGMDLEELLAAVESRYIRLALDRAGGLQVRAAELLRLSFRQFRYKIQKHGLRSRAQAIAKPDLAD